tara:strand:+ start:4607 stop:5029 length:423 start_codon:yes stop_codon:yes gene_type:complete
MVETIVILSAFSLLSVSLNISLIWYVKKTTSSLLFISENLSFLKESVDSFAKHIKKVSELDMFYGDETLGFLIDHAVALQDRISEFNDIIQLSEEEEIILDDREYEIEGQGEASSSPSSEAIRATDKKHVFYGGTRRGNN